MSTIATPAGGAARSNETAQWVSKVRTVDILIDIYNSQNFGNKKTVHELLKRMPKHPAMQSALTAIHEYKLYTAYHEAKKASTKEGVSWRDSNRIRSAVNRIAKVIDQVNAEIADAKKPRGLGTYAIRQGFLDYYVILTD